MPSSPRIAPISIPFVDCAKRSTSRGSRTSPAGESSATSPASFPSASAPPSRRAPWPEPAIFSYLAPFTPDDEMWRTFNMGIGMIVVVDEASAATALRILEGEIFVVGDIVASEQRRVQILE